MCSSVDFLPNKQDTCDPLKQFYVQNCYFLKITLTIS